MSHCSDNDDGISDSLSSDNTGENLLIPKKSPVSQSYFVEDFNQQIEALPKSRSISESVRQNSIKDSSHERKTSEVSNTSAERKRTSRTSNISQISNDIRHSQISRITGTSTESQQDPCSPNSSRTVATFLLTNNNEESNLTTGKLKLETTDERRTSSYYPPDITDRTGNVLKSYGQSYPRDSNSEQFEEAVMLLQREAKSHEFQISPSNITIPENEFKPHEYKIIKKASQASLRIDTSVIGNAPIKRAEVTPHSPSLLNNILIPSSKQDTGIEIPALRAVSGSKNVSPKIVSSEVSKLNKVTEPTFPKPARLTKVTKMTDSQLELAVDILQDFRRDIHPYPDGFDLEANVRPMSISDAEINKESVDLSGHPMPIQHISSASISSFDSKKQNFTDIYSVPRIIGVLICCFMIPTLFFMISIGSKGGFSDLRLMRVIMNRKHQVGKLKGFKWDIDIDWFRNLCFILGTVEVLGILACIGAGVGVGLRRQSH